MPTWASLSTSGLKTVIVPETVKEIIILSDNDLSGQLAADKAGVRFLREGRESVRIARPIGKDFNVDLQLPDNIVRLPRKEAHA